jgi:rubrerythrin
MPDLIRHLQDEIARRESAQRFYDNAEGEQFFRELHESGANQRCLDIARLRLRAAMRRTCMKCSHTWTGEDSACPACSHPYAKVTT